MRDQKLPIAALERIDDRCADFERKWQANESPSIEDALHGDFSPIERHALLAELIVLDADYRRRRGESPNASEYLARFPEDSAAIRNALQEGGKSTGAFEPPTVEQLASLFPSLQILELIGAGGDGRGLQSASEGDRSRRGDQDPTGGVRS